MRSRWLVFSIGCGVAAACSAAKTSAPLPDTSGAGGTGTTGAGAAGAGKGGATSGSSMAMSGGLTSIAVGSGGGGGANECIKELTAVVRDFSSSHPDFEKFGGSGATTGLVKNTLLPDGTPEHAAPGPTSQTSGPQNFAQWYHDVQGVNHKFTVKLPLTEVKKGVYSYSSNAFFPVDNKGFGNENNPNNFHFTTQVHTTFEYKGGEVFTFNGDDDLWLFINNTLALDLGGLHPAVMGSVDLDQAAMQLGITKGKTYSMDIFHAERHTDQSNFQVETTITCFVPQPT
jgi:fibro-slime domain-containing protein